MNGILRASRFFVVVAVLGCLVMFGAVTIVGTVAVVQAVIHTARGGFALDDIATVTVYAFKILDLFLLGTILYIIALGLGALFLGAEKALPVWFRVRELQDLKNVLFQSVVVVMLVSFLGDVLKWERAADVLFVGSGVGLVIVAVALMLRFGQVP
jgi:uncharacterized membrane protein YqhA